MPDGVCFVDVRVTGGAGGHNMVGGGVSQPDANGAAARISARYAVVPGESFSGFVGGGGAQDRTAGINGGGNGGELTGSNAIHPGAGGGGWTSLQLDGVDVIVAGGGGGSGGGHSLDEGVGGNAGLPSAAGVTAGSAGVDGRDNPDTNIVTSGKGGGTAAAGAGGTNSADSTRNGTAGTGRNGGDAGADDTPDTGGGGGGGWFGGGGAASTVGNGSGGLSAGGVTGAGGGGGSSYVAPTSPGLAGFAVSGISSVAVGKRATAGAGQDGDVALDWVPCDYDLAVTKSVDDPTPAPGDTVTWTVSVTNNGDDPMTRGDLVTIDDTLPGPGAKTVSSVTVTGGSNDRGLIRGAVTCGLASGDAMPATVTCSRPYADGVASSLDSGNRGLDSGETITIVYTQAIPSGTAGGTTIDNVVTVTDRGPAGNNTDNATVTVTAGPPVATDDSRTTPFDTPVDLPASGNDSPSDPGTPVVPGSTVFTSPDATNGGKTLVTPEGTWQVNVDGTVTFTPVAGYTGTTPPVEYRISDAAGGTDTADLVVTVRPGPSASPNTDTTPQDVDVTVDPLANDTPGVLADGSAGSWDETSVVFAGPNPGTVSNGGKTLTVPGEGVYTVDPVSGEVTFDPEPQFIGVATPVTYEVTDSNGNDVRSTITITVTPIVPVANDDDASTPFDTPVTLPAVRDDASGASSAPLVPASTVFTSPDATNGAKTLVTPQGTWQVNGDGSVTFTPAPGYVGTTPPVEYEITDANGTTDTALLTVTVRPGPVARPDTATTPHDTNVTVPLLPNDTPGPLADGTPGSWDPASVVFTSPNATNGGKTLVVPGQGVYTIDPVTGAVTFDPEPGFSGQATPVDYQVTDRNGKTARSTLTITVGPAPTPEPPAEDDYDLVLVKRALGGTQARVGDTVRYQLTVRNTGTDAAPGPITLKDPLPDGLELVSATGKGWTCKTQMGRDTVTCVLKKGLGAGKKAAPVLVVAKATTAGLGRVVNVANVRVAGETVRSNNKGRAAITVVPAQLPATGFRPTAPGA